MHAAVVVFPGSNREGDVVRALKLGGSKVSMAWHADHDLPAGTDLVVLPGGFSYGDYLRCGAIAGRAAIMDAVRRHAARFDWDHAAAAYLALYARLLGLDDGRPAGHAPARSAAVAPG